MDSNCCDRYSRISRDLGTFDVNKYCLNLHQTAYRLDTAAARPRRRRAELLLVADPENAEIVWHHSRLVRFRRGGCSNPGNVRPETLAP